jgi:signal transduction histidine kinase
MRCKDGSHKWILDRGQALWDQAGNPVRMAGSLTDIADRKQAEEALFQQAEELARSNAELEQFAQIASHDLQEPLRKIQAFGDRLESKFSDVLGQEGQDYLERMQNAAGRMQTLINDLLSLSRVTTKAQPFVAVNLREVAQAVLSDLEIRIEEVGGRVELDALPSIEADPLQMRQLLQNLIGNALKFHAPGTAPIVRVESQILGCYEHSFPQSWSVSEWCQLRVSDNGIGFDEKYLDRIFKIFQRLHSRHEYQGTGMGLAICRKIAERHGGHITATSTPGQGASFIVTLPVQQT